MYHVTCPACDRGMRSSFVRFGATARCTHCGHVFAVQSQHVRRQVRDRGGDARGLVFADSPHASKRPWAQVDDGASAAAATRPGQAAPPSGPPTERAAPPGPPVPPVPAPAPRRSIRRRRLAAITRSRDRQLTVWLAMVTVGLLVGLIVGVRFGSARLRSSVMTGAGPGGVAAPEVGAEAAALVDAQPLVCEPWEPVDAVFDAAAPVGPVVLGAGDWSRREDGAWLFTVSIESTTAASFLSGVLELMLVSEDGRVFGRASRPLVLISQRVQQQVVVPVPVRWRRPSSVVQGRIHPGPESGADAVWLDAEVEVAAAGATFDVAVHLSNGSPRAVGGTIVLLRGVNDSGRPVGAWRLVWPDLLAPGAGVVLRAKVSVDAAEEGGTWEASAQGRAEHAAAAPALPSWGRGRDL